MPRTKRPIATGQICHITHRCHDAVFLLRFAMDRRRYRWWLWAGLQRYRATLLAYTITANHVHLLTHAREATAISDLIQLVHGRVAQEYNRRKQRRGAFWTDRFHTTLVESGEHLWRCLLYIDLNMVRAGAVQHPGEWPWCSYTEWRSGRQRHQILARQSLLQLLGYADDADFRRDQETAIAAALGRGGGQREGFWSESVAVGSEQFVRQLAMTVEHRADLQFEEHRASDGQAIWSVRESRPRYLQEAGGISRYQGAAWQEMPRN